jgi:hypothetical protein
MEVLLAMWAAGGERDEDLDQRRHDHALSLLPGHNLPAAQTAARVRSGERGLYRIAMRLIQLH